VDPVLVSIRSIRRSPTASREPSREGRVSE
jgi:hypothetical protein